MRRQRQASLCLSRRSDDDVGVSPYLYSPARRNSWLVGADPCRANGWMEVRSSAEHAEHIQAGASGPWQEYNGTGWVRTAAIRALPPCSTPADDCVYVSGSSHQQHTHGVYVRIAMRCDGKPVYMQQTGAAWDRDDDNPRVSVARGGSRDGVRGGRAGLDGGGGSDYRRLYLFSPSGRESWMVGRRASPLAGSRCTRPSIAWRASTAPGASTSLAARGRPTRTSSCSSTHCRTRLSASRRAPTVSSTTRMACYGGSHRSRRSFRRRLCIRMRRMLLLESSRWRTNGGLTRRRRMHVTNDAALGGVSDTKPRL